MMSEYYFEECGRKLVIDEDATGNIWYDLATGRAWPSHRHEPSLLEMDQDGPCCDPDIAAAEALYDILLAEYADDQIAEMQLAEMEAMNAKES